jgi:hypothetical protein
VKQTRASKAAVYDCLRAVVRAYGRPHGPAVDSAVDVLIESVVNAVDWYRIALAMDKANLPLDLARQGIEILRERDHATGTVLPLERAWLEAVNGCIDALIRHLGRPDNLLIDAAMDLFNDRMECAIDIYRIAALMPNEQLTPGDLLQVREDYAERRAA